MRETNSFKTCRGCFWADSCKNDEKCDGFTPLDTYSIIRGEYEQDLRMRATAYEEIVREMED